MSSTARRSTSEPASDDSTTQTEDDRDARRIHVLGVGGIGKFIAHSILNAPGAPPISLIFHRPGYVSDLPNQQCDLTVHVNNERITVGPFDAEVAYEETRPGAHDSMPDHDTSLEKYGHLFSEKPIKSLILTVKANHTLSALRRVKHRLSPDSTVLFLQNGMGMIEEVNEHVWPNEAERPTYVVGVNSHGVFTRNTFEAVHAGRGFIYLASLARASPPLGDETTAQSAVGSNSVNAKPPPFNENTRQLLLTFLRIPILGATTVNESVLLDRQLEKLAVNCIINPLTVFLDARNGAILNNFAVTRTMRLLLSEISVVFQALPEVRDKPTAHITFSPSRLESLVVGVASKTAENISSMLQDTRRGKETEIDYINGYIVKRGEEQGIKPVMNYMLVNMVKAKQNMITKEQQGWEPRSVPLQSQKPKGDAKM